MLRWGSTGMISVALMIASVTTVFATDLDIKVSTAADAPTHYVAVMLQTEPGATCKAHVNATFGNFDLPATTTDANGKLTWGIRSNSYGKPAQGHITGTCRLKDREGSFTADYTVPGTP
jgi:hypothetical protein